MAVIIQGLEKSIVFLLISYLLQFIWKIDWFQFFDYIIISKAWNC